MIRLATPVMCALFSAIMLSAHPGSSFIKFATDCENADEIAAIVYERYASDVFEQRHHTTYTTVPLPDGRTLHRFDPPGGNGSYAYQPCYIFAKTNGTLSLIFDSQGRSTEVADYLINDQPVFLTTWREFTSNDQVSVIQTSLHFRHQTNTIPAYIHTNTYQHADGTHTSHTQWINQQAYLSATQSWSYTIQPGDTLSHIALHFKTPVNTIIEQSGLSSPNHLQPGNTLSVTNIPAYRLGHPRARNL